MPHESRYRILALDGGGVWSLIEVRALMRLFGEHARGRAVLGAFDLVAGNSAGSLVVAALVEDLTLREAHELLMDEATRKRLFTHTQSYPVNPLAHWVGPRWSTEQKLETMRALLPRTGEMPLDALPGLIGGRRPHVMLIGFDYDRERAVFFRSDLASRAANFVPHAPPTLVLAAGASSDAPVRYFDRPVEIADPSGARRRYWDGGVGGYNNPVLAAVIEALANGHAASSIDALSIGTGSTVRPFAGPYVDPSYGKERDDQGLVTDARKLAAAVLDEPPDAASFIAHVALGQRVPTTAGEVVSDGSLVRMNPVASPVLQGTEWIKPPRSLIRERDFKTLTSLDMDEVEPANVKLIDRFAGEWLDDIFPNQPIRAGRDFGCEIGHPRFSGALAAWRSRAAD